MVESVLCREVIRVVYVLCVHVSVPNGQWYGFLAAIVVHLFTQEAMVVCNHLAMLKFFLTSLS